jgi:hypothetical protein
VAARTLLAALVSTPVATTDTRMMPSRLSSKVAPTMMLASTLLGDHPDREDAEFACGARHHRRGTGSGAATHARGDEHHVGTGQVVADLVDHLFGGGAADVGLRTRAETFGHRHAHLDDAFGPRRGQSLGIRVGDDPALRQAGWDEMLQIREEVGFTKGRIIVRGKLVSRGKGKRADYILYFKPNIPLALIEAKDNAHSVIVGALSRLEGPDG